MMDDGQIHGWVPASPSAPSPAVHDTGPAAVLCTQRKKKKAQTAAEQRTGGEGKTVDAQSDCALWGCDGRRLMQMQSWSDADCEEGENEGEEEDRKAQKKTEEINNDGIARGRADGR